MTVPDPDIIARVVAEMFGSDPRILSRQAQVVKARDAFVFLARVHCRHSYPDLAEYLGHGRGNHSVPMQAAARAAKRLATDDDFADRARQAWQRLTYCPTALMDVAALQLHLVEVEKIIARLKAQEETQ